MRFSHRTALACVVAAVGLVMAGCGGGSSVNLPASYAGTWTGTWTTPEPDNGTASIIVFSTGGVTGTFISIPKSNTADLVGRLDSTGRFVGRYTYRGGRSYVARGKLDIPIGNTMAGVLDIYEDANSTTKTTTATVTLQK